MYNLIAEQVALLISTPNLVKEWLITKQPDDIVGQTNLSKSCLLACFLLEQGFSVSIGNFFDLSTFTIEGESKYRELPDFAMDFAERLDEETLYFLEDNLSPAQSLEEIYPNYPSVPISASIALKILESIEAAREIDF